MQDKAVFKKKALKVILMAMTIGSATCSRVKTNTMASFREYNITGLRAIIRQYREAHGGALPDSQGELFSMDGRAQLAAVFWPDQLVKQLGPRPIGWPEDSGQLEKSRIYRFLRKEKVAQFGILVIEAKALRDLGPSAPDGDFCAISDGNEVIWVNPKDVPPVSAFMTE